MKIDIQIEDVRKYASVALLVDRNDFLSDVQEIRNHIKLRSVPFTFPNYPHVEANRIVGFYKKGQISLNGTRELLEEFCSQNGIQNLYTLDKTLGTSVLFAESLTKKYSKDRLYIPIVLASILIARIQEEDFLSTQMLTINPKAMKEMLTQFNENEEIVTISVNRESTPKEVQKTFDFIQRYYFKTKKPDENEGLKSIYSNTLDTSPPDTADNIKRDRDWYWLHKQGASYNQIKKQHPHISLRGIELAIKRYADNLK